MSQARKPPKKAGYLLKKGPLKVWQKRWFVLEEGELSYYRNVEQYQDIVDGNMGCLSCFTQRGKSINNEAEVIHASMTKGWEAAFRRFDFDGSGSIDKDELMQIMRSFGREVSAEEATQMIREADADGNGEIDMDEFKQIMSANAKNQLWGDATQSAKKMNKKGKDKNNSKLVSGTAEADLEDADFDADIDFVVNLGTRKMTCRASSNAEKVSWTTALSSATRVRSYSSKNLDEDVDEDKLNDQLHHKMKHLKLEDLDIGDIIGSGTMGTVRLTVHVPTGMRVAVKIIPKRKFFMNKKLQQSTERELDMLDKISDFQHPSIVQMYGYINADDNVYIALELCEGGELLEQLEQVGNYSEATAADIIKVTVETLGYLHSKGIVHRDVKPENLLLKVQGNPSTIKVADFGLSNIIEGKSLQTVCGSPAYMAPEVHNMQDYNEKVDLWSVGVMLYLLLCGTLPFCPPRMMDKAESEEYSFAGKLWRNVSQGAKDLVSHLLVADPANRYGVAETLAHPWITGGAPGDDLEGTRKALALFSAKRKFKGIAHAVVASKRMTRVMASFASATVAPKLASGMEFLQDVRYTATDGAVAAGTGALSGAKLAGSAAAAYTPDLVKGAVMDNTKTLRTGLGTVTGSLQEGLISQFHASPRADARSVKMATVRKWLEKSHLGEYSDKFEEEGYDDIEALQELEEDEVDELIEEIGLKKGHARNFRKRLRALIAETNGPGVDAAGQPIGDGTEFLNLPMPSGSADQEKFVLGVSIGRVRQSEVSGLTAPSGHAMMTSTTDADVDVNSVHAAHPRVRSPPRAASPRSPSGSSSPRVAGAPRPLGR